MNNRNWGQKKSYNKKKNYYYRNKKGYKEEKEEPKSKAQIQYEKLYNRIVAKLNASTSK